MAKRTMEIIDHSGVVKYRRPEGDPLLAEALKTPGYSVRPQRCEECGGFGHVTNPGLDDTGTECGRCEGAGIA